MKVMFDNCAFDHLCELVDDIFLFFEKTQGKIEYYTTAIQIEEIAQTGDDKKDIRIFKTLCLAKMRPIIVNTPFVFDETPFGLLEFSDEESETYDYIKGNSKKHIHDAIIGDVSSLHDFVLITDDTRLTEKSSNMKVTTMSSFDFHKYVSNNIL